MGLFGCKYAGGLFSDLLRTPYCFGNNSNNSCCNGEGSSESCTFYKKFETQVELIRMFDGLRRTLERNERIDAANRSNFTQAQKTVLTDIVGAGSDASSF